MDQETYKQAVIEAAKKQLKQEIDDFRSSINRMEEGVEASQEIGWMDQMESTSEATREYIDKLAEQLNFANQEYEKLNRLQAERTQKQVGVGSVVITKEFNFLVGVSLEDFEVEGDRFVGLSDQSPLYQELQGHKEGDEVPFRDKRYLIQKIY